MNALLRARLAKPAPPQPSALHDARGKSLALLIWELGDRWEENDPDGDVLPYVRATVAKG